MTFTVSAAALFTVLLIVTIRFAAHKIWHALIAFLAGFFIAATGAAPTIDKLVISIYTALRRM
ncbi:MAG TPA: hypothetical protein VL551_22070 [Actinospica sp.]|nr:hypothetical protein [Actinospica sp.]